MYRVTERLQALNWHQGGNTLLQCRNKQVLIRTSRRHYDTGIAPKKGGIGKPLFYTVAATTIVSGGVIAYAKYDQKFRKQLNEYVPGSDAFIRFICQEEHANADNVKNSITNSTDNVKTGIYKLIGKEEKTEGSKPAVSVPPALVKIKPAPEPESKKDSSAVSPTKLQSEARSVKSNPEEIKPEKSAPKSEKKDDFQKYDLSKLEKEAVDAVKQAIVAYNAAVGNLKEYREDVADLIEKSVQKDDHNIWFRIKEKTELKENVIQQAEDKGNAALKKIEHLKLIITDPKADLDPETKGQVEDNIKDALNNLINTRAVFSLERSNSSVTEKYSQKVEESRKTLTKELGLLFPSLVVDSGAIVTDEDLELFVLYASQLLNFYQKELQKLETIGKSKIDTIIEQSKVGNPDAIKEIIDVEVDKIRKEFDKEFLKKELSLKVECERLLREQLRRQAEVHADHLDEVIELKNREMDRRLKQNVNEKIEDMRINYNRQLARIIGRMKGLDFALKEKVIAEKQAKRSQMLWNACQSLILAIKSGTNTKSWEEQLKPLGNEVSAISKAAAEEDDLVGIVIASIPSEAITRGVYSELALRDRFLNVEKVAYRLANLSDGFVTLPKVFLSYLQSFLLIRLSKPIPNDELANKPFDASSLDNYDILCRARYWIDRGDFEQSLKYMNLLKGAARAIANEWMNETRIFLETQQAANLLLSHAVYSSFIYLQNSS